jgi:hypothetical protein
LRASALWSNYGDLITALGVVTRIDVTDIEARSTVELVAAVAILGLETVISALTVQRNFDNLT